MKIEATVHEIRLLLVLAELDAQKQDPPPEALRTRREASRKRVPSALLERYEMLVEAARYPAIVVIERGTCSGCHVRLPTMVESQARRSPAVHTCPRCRRMLHAPELLSEESSPGAGSQKKPGHRRGSAATAGERS